MHGLGINPADGSLFIATHTGLFRVGKDSRKAVRIADRYQDTMGFSISARTASSAPAIPTRASRSCLRYSD